jgi:hypothetical protein
MAAARAAMTVGGGVRTARLLPRFRAAQEVGGGGGAGRGGGASAGREEGGRGGARSGLGFLLPFGRRWRGPVYLPVVVRMRCQRVGSV